MVTSRDVARAAGVSQATVSRVLSSGTNVREETRLRVLEAMRTVGYAPNAAAQSMKTGRTGSVGVVVSDLTNPFHPQLLEALGGAFDRAGLRMTVWIADAKNDAALQAIRERSIDGVVFTTATTQSQELIDALDRRSPVVLLNRAVPGLECDQVASDNVVGGEVVADYLLAHGRTRAAFVGGTPLASTLADRRTGFGDRMATAGFPLADTSIAHGDYSHASGYRSMTELLDSGAEIDAVFCSNDVLAFGALDVARARGLRVPEDLWVVGYDDTDMASWESFDLTTVRQDVSQMAELGADLLVRRMADPVRPVERVVLTPDLVVRGSTAHAGR
jgi:LacI family transcriptional regulator